MISSEATEQEQAKMRIAEKRREMKEKKEREAELERQRQVFFIFNFFLIEKKGKAQNQQKNYAKFRPKKYGPIEYTVSIS